MRVDTKPGLVRLAAVVLACAGAASNAAAACSGQACTDVKVERLYVSNSDAYVRLNAAGLSCAVFFSNYIKLDPASPRFNTLYATLLMAQALQQTVNVDVVAPSGPCILNRVYNE